MMNDRKGVAAYMTAQTRYNAKGSQSRRRKGSGGREKGRVEGGWDWGWGRRVHQKDERKGGVGVCKRANLQYKPGNKAPVVCAVCVRTCVFL